MPVCVCIVCICVRCTPFLPTILANFAFSRNCVCLNNLYIKCGKSNWNYAHRVCPKNNYVLVQFSLFAFYIITITFSFKMYEIYNIHIFNNSVLNWTRQRQKVYHTRSLPLSFCTGGKT